MSYDPLRADPGTLNLNVFDQDQAWLDITGVPFLLHEMTPTYRANVIAHLLQYAPDYHEAKVEQRRIEERVAPHLEDAELPERPGLPEDPVEWVESTPLMRRLHALTPGWANHVSEDRDELTDDDTGRWVIDTENSWYLIDLDARTSTRLPDLPGTPRDLRRDAEPLPLLELHQCRRAHPAVLLLDVRGDGVPTMRLTSLVRRITRAEPSP